MLCESYVFITFHFLNIRKSYVQKTGEGNGGVNRKQSYSKSNIRFFNLSIQ